MKNFSCLDSWQTLEAKWNLLIEYICQGLFSPSSLYFPLPFSLFFSLLPRVEDFIQFVHLPLWFGSLKEEGDSFRVHPRPSDHRAASFSTCRCQLSAPGRPWTATELSFQRNSFCSHRHGLGPPQTWLWIHGLPLISGVAVIFGAFISLGAKVEGMVLIPCCCCEDEMESVR